MCTLRKLTVALLSLGTALAAMAAPGGYHIAQTIRLGGAGFWDYVTVDPAAHRVYLSHGTHVAVVDTTTNAVSGDVPDTEGVHGVALAPGLGRGFTSNGRAGTVTVFDLASLKTLATVKVTGANPDAILYEPISRRIFTFNGRSSNATAIDAADGKVVGTLDLGARPEFAVADGKGAVFVNLEDASALLAFDARSLKVEGRWPLAPCEEPSGLAIDRAHRRLFSVCRNALMAVIDADSGKVVATVPIGHGVDGAAFDPGTDLAFASNGEGSLTVVHEDTPEKFTLVGNVPTKRGARTIGLDPVTHRIYLPTAEFGPAPPPTAERPHPRPSIVPGTFEVLVLEP
jgi:DNA-binding beta-propeller fold protein YncE